MHHNYGCDSFGELFSAECSPSKYEWLVLITTAVGNLKHKF
jgi:hypothetical protein